MLQGEAWFPRAEESVNAAVQWLKLGVVALGAVVVGVGVVLGAWYFFHAVRRGRHEDYNDVRLVLARYLALALEIQLAADILSTAIAPSWDQVGKLAAIAVIRTGLNYFLGKEIAAEKRERFREGGSGGSVVETSG